MTEILKNPMNINMDHSSLSLDAQERALFAMGMIFLLALLALLPIEKSVVSYCPFQYFTHVPCPFCGLTHSIHFFLTGRVVRAFASHAFGPLITLIMVSLVPILGSQKNYLKFAAFTRSRMGKFLSVAAISLFLIYGIIRMFLY
jgi:hypothetical protein